MNCPRLIARLVLVTVPGLLVLLLFPVVGRAAISIEASGTTTGGVYSLSDAAYTQNFDALPASGSTFTWANDTTLAGWFASNASGTFDASGVVIDGSSNMVDLKLGSVGTAGNTDRALAYHTRVDIAPTYLGLGFTNNSGRELNAFTLTYTPEQWRENTSARNLTFTVQYRVGAIPGDLSATAGWTTLGDLAFTSANGSLGATATLTASAVAVSVPAGSTLWFRWVCANSATATTSSNDIIAIDNVRVSLTAAADGRPSITTPPAAQTASPGATVTLSVAAAGDAPLSYQWRKGGVAVDGATTASLVLASVQSGDAGDYTVVVTNAKGSVTSPAAVLTVNAATAPVIGTPPQSQAVTVGDNVTFTVAATGSPTPTYQWRHDGTDLAGATAATLSLAAVKLADAGAYSVVVTNSVSSVTSAAATLTVQAALSLAPAITTQPTAQTVAVGANATFSVVASGTAPLGYQWTKDGAPIAGATAATLTLAGAQPSAGGAYQVKVTNDAGSATSAAVTLTISNALPSSAFNLTGFATAGTGTTGGGVIAETDAAYRKCGTPLEFVQAIADSNKTAGKVKVVEITNDLNLGWIEVGSAVQGLASNPLRSHATPKLHPTLIASGVSLLDIKAKSPLTIFSASGATIKHCNFNIKGTSNLIIRNLKFDEMWEWDEASKGNYDSNDWDFITISNGGDATNIWIDHCTFTKAYDGIVDLKAGTQYATLSWCKYLGDDGATNPNSPVRVQLAALEANRSAYGFYNFLRTNGYSVDDIATIIQGHDKGHLMGSNSLKTENNTLSATFHHQWFKNVWDRVVPRLRGGNVHDYNIYVDDVGALAARRLRDTRAAQLSSALQNTLDNTYSFRPPLNGTISTEGGAILVENSVYAGCLWPLRNNQTDPSNAAYTGKIKALDTIYSFLNSDSSTTVVRGNSTDSGSPLGPFQATVIPFSWNLPNNQLPYAYTPDDPAQLPPILAIGAGAGVLTWSKENWLKTSYVDDAGVAPAITRQPQSQTVATGADATFTIQASGSGALAYQWKKAGANLTDGGRISGASSAVLSVSTAAAIDAGNYTVVVTNAVGSVTSDAATLTVTGATLPAITNQPQSLTVAAGAEAEFALVVAGSAPFSYQWKHAGTDLVGATGSTLSFAAVRAADAGTYTVVVSNSAGSVTSAAATLTVTAAVAPTITWGDPAAMTYGSPLGAAQLNATASAAGTLVYTPAAGAILGAGVHELSVVFTPTDTAGYTGATKTVSLTVNPASPGLAWLSPAAIVAGTALSATQLNATASVAGTFVYLPAAGTVLNPGAGQTLRVTFTPSDQVNYTSATATATITVTAGGPAITTQPGSVSVKAGASATFTVVAGGAAPLGYQWRKDGKAIPGATGATLTFAAAKVSDAGAYTVIVSNGAGAVTSDVAALTVLSGDFAGAYFGRFGSGGDWALSVRADNTGTFIAYLPQRHSALVLGLLVNGDGSFSVTGSEIRPLVTEIRAAASWRVPAGDSGRPGRATGFTLSGQITSGVVTGGVDGLGETFVGAVDAPTGGAQALVGFYTASAVGTATGNTYAVVGASGATVVVTATPTVVGGGAGALAANGRLTFTAADGPAVSVTIDPQSRRIAVAVTPAGAPSPINFAGLPDSIVAVQRLVNLSTRSFVGTDSRVLIVGFVIGGSAPKQVLVRAVGPALLAQGVTGVLARPKIELHHGSAVVAANAGWGTAANAAEIAGVSVATGAFALTDGSRDAALLVTLDPGVYSALVSGADGGTGVALVEIYEAPVEGPDARKLVNLSGRGLIGTDSNTLIAGFVIAGNAPKTVLVRAVGPGLVPLGVPDAVPAVNLALVHDSAVIATNDRWGTAATSPAVVTASATVGAFPLVDGSGDAALLVTLPPGVYSVVATGAGGATGVALFEVYELP